MLARYRIVRGKRPPGDPLPQGVRVDIRKHTRHCLRSVATMVTMLLDDPSEATWQRYRREYLAVLAERFADDPAPFEELARRGRDEDVYLGCNCPTKRNPDPRHCHTVLALEFMKARFPALDVRLEPPADPEAE